MENTLVMFNWSWVHKLLRLVRRPRKEQWSAELFDRNKSHYYDAKYDGNNYNLKNRR